MLMPQAADNSPHTMSQIPCQRLLHPPSGFIHGKWEFVRQQEHLQIPTQVNATQLYPIPRPWSCRALG